MSCMITVLVKGIEFDLLYDAVYGVVTPSTLNLSDKKTRDALQKAQQICEVFSWVCNYHQDFEAQSAPVETLLRETRKTKYCLTQYADCLTVHAIDYIQRTMAGIEDSIQRMQHIQKTRTLSRRSPDGYVYLIESQYGYKIGKSSNPDSRTRTIKTAMPFPAQRICLIKTDDMHTLESTLHSRFANKRLNGEWFKLSPNDVDYIKSLEVQGE